MVHVGSFGCENPQYWKYMADFSHLSEKSLDDIMYELGQNMDGADWHNEYYRMPLLRRYLEEHPYLANCDVLEVNCLGMKLRDHTGRHPTTMEGLATYMDEWELTEFAIKFEQWLNNPEQDLLILPICRRERHRSVGFRTLILEWLKARFPDGTILIGRAGAQVQPTHVPD